MSIIYFSSPQKMKYAAVILIVAMIFMSTYTGKSCRLTIVCKDEKVSTQPPFVCQKTKCDQFCAKLNPRGWGKCKDKDNYICQCFYLCYKDIHLPKTTQPN